LLCKFIANIQQLKSNLHIFTINLLLAWLEALKSSFHVFHLSGVASIF